MFETEGLLTLAGMAALFWVLVSVFTIIYPHKLFNSFFLFLALLSTLMAITVFITKDMMMSVFTVLIVIFLALLVTPLLLIINGITMIRNEGRSFANLLSLFLGIGIWIGEFSFFADVIFRSFEITTFEKVNGFLLFVGVTVLYFSFIILLFVMYSIFFQFVPRLWNFEYIIIHGCGLLGGERVSKLLSNRIDKAIKVFHKGKDKAMIICSGGKGPDEKISEAEAIANYLKEKGIPEDHILLEDRSTSTEENLVYSYDIIKQRGPSKRIALISSNYHIYRCVLLAHQLKIPCVGIGAKVAPYYWPSAIIREFVAVHLEKKNLIWIMIGYLIVISPFIFVLLGR
ncbi:MAG: YdcF family protein [Erysipelotrichaceae bacterium]|nr:YdcF family protein [Erysipelotrichaceae bacterium]